MKDKVIIVTGGSGLLGKAIVADLKEKGATVINADINVEKDLASGTYYCDVTSIESIKETVEKVNSHFGRIDGLVNNAYPRTKDWGTSFENMTADSLKDNVDWQLNSYILFCQEVLKIMKIQKSGSIVNMTSIYGVVGNDFTIYEGTNLNPPAAYSAIKGGLINVTRYLASKYGEFGLRVNCISPGGIFDHQPEVFVKAYEKKVPMKRMGNPEDISPCVSFLLANDSKYITGHNLIVDGGWTAI
jgi:NAD(P)-dependent dehydrogenase (short-subunit alcohol dehydrogenase family)